LNNSEILKPWDLFPSPPWVVELLVEVANIEPGISCLEPSAGFGTLATSLQQAGALVEVIEPISELQTILLLQGLLLVGADFLTTPNLSNRYERVVQNPPFSQQISHVKRAYQCLKAGGRLVSLVSHSPWQYNTSFYKQFRYWLNTVNAQVQELPWGLFVNSDRYTCVECCLITINKI
jgi:hypothetical protein